MPITEFFIFRHGETDWNKERRFQGQTDVPLNQRGKDQSSTLAILLRKYSPQVILTSDLARAKETALIANSSLNIPLFAATELRECNLGDAEGLLRETVIEKYGERDWGRWLSVKDEDLLFGYPNGETKQSQLQRVRAYLENFCKSQKKFQRIAVSTHGGCLRRLVHSCQGSPVDPVPLPNCVLYKISYDSFSSKWLFHGMLE